MSELRDFELQEVALRAVKLAAAEYGLPAALKPCVAYYLNGHDVGAVARHDVAFTLAMEMRGLTRANEAQMRAVLRHWAPKVGYPGRKATRALGSALAKKPNGEWRWHSPGLVKKPGSRYAEVLGPICEAVGCPANCPPFRAQYVGRPGETYDRFVDLGWPRELRRHHRHAPEIYEAICRREAQLGFAPGCRLLTSYAQLGTLADVDNNTVGRMLRYLSERGLLTFIPGSGSGPRAKDRKPSEVQRVIPVPSVSDGTSSSAITTGDSAPPKDISGSTPPTEPGDGTGPPDMGDTFGEQKT